METKICNICGTDKGYDQFFKDKRLKSGISNTCKECKKIINHNYRSTNPEKYKSQQKKYRDLNKNKSTVRYQKWYKDNKDKRTNYCVDYEKERKKTDPKFKILRNVRVRIYHFLKSNKLRKFDNTINLIGCDLPSLKKHLEDKFTDNMSWDNYGKYGWHIDHIIPLSIAKTEEEIYKLCRYTNLQPLWWQDNLKKSNKLF